jgi:hypothetical protein
MHTSEELDLTNNPGRGWVMVRSSELTSTAISQAWMPCEFIEPERKSLSQKMD